MRFARLKETPVGYREQVRRRRDVSTLSQSGGRAKAQKNLTRNIIGLETPLRVQRRNAEEGHSGQIYGDRISHVKTGWVFASLLSRTEMESIFETPKVMAVGEKKW